MEDISMTIDLKQYAGRKGTGTEHMIVCLVDRVKSLLDKPGMTAVIAAAVDWSMAFDRVAEEVAVVKMIRMGIRSSLIPIIIDFLTGRCL